MNQFTLVNGVASAGIPGNDRGLAFGDGVFETMRVVDGCLPLWNYHKQRLLQGLKQMAIQVPSEYLNASFMQLFEYIQTLGERQQTGITKLIVTRGSSSTGYQYRDGINANVILSFEPKQPSVLESEHLIKCQTPMYECMTLAGVKHLSRLENVLARREAHAAGYRDGLLCDARDNMIETTNSNLFFIDNSDCVSTPLLDQCGVAGVLRRMILDEVAPSLGLEIAVKKSSFKGLDKIKAAFKCNAVTGVVEIASIATHHFHPNNQLIDSVKRAVEHQLTQPIIHSREHFVF